MAEQKPMDWDALQEALNNDGKISKEEREVLITRGIPDRLLEALEDGVLDEKERADLVGMGIPVKLLDALADGHLSDEEKVMMKQELSYAMKAWREQQMRDVFKALNRISKK